MLEAILMAAGTLNSSIDWSIPTNENAIPVNIVVGKSTLKRVVHKAAVCSSNPLAKSVVMYGANIIPKTVINVVNKPISVTKLLDKRKASFLPLFYQVILLHL